MYHTSTKEESKVNCRVLLLADTAVCQEHHIFFGIWIFVILQTGFSISFSTPLHNLFLQ